MFQPCGVGRVSMALKGLGNEDNTTILCERRGADELRNRLISYELRNKRIMEVVE
jgi:hypothetical protein